MRAFLAGLSIMFALPSSAYAVGCLHSAANFHFPAQPLGSALSNLSHQTHRPILVDRSLVAHKKAPAVDGRYTPSEALRLLTGGTNLEFVLGQDGFLMHPAEYDEAQHQKTGW